tara:strand:- start:122 stop:343 length:222 start_codon:yes stop_codon:yes gene_type:complete
MATISLKKKEETYVDPYTAELFSMFTDVDSETSLEELVILAEDFMEVIAHSFQGMSCDYEAEDYAKNYLENTG